MARDDRVEALQKEIVSLHEQNDLLRKTPSKEIAAPFTSRWSKPFSVRRYFRERFKQVEAVLRAPGELDYLKMVQALACAKAFYYDCLDGQKKDEVPADFEARRRNQEELFNNIREVPGYHVRTGTLAGGRQKEVDVALAVDMLTHSFYKNTARAVLIAGDLDFRPVIESLILGTYVEVVSAKSTTAKGLQWPADEHVVLDFSVMYSWCTDEFRRLHPIPILSTGTDGFPPNGWNVQRSGTYRGQQALLNKQGSDWKNKISLSSFYAAYAGSIASARYPL